MRFLGKIKSGLPVMILSFLTFCLFFYNLGYPKSPIFDEAYHLTFAQKYLNGVFFQELHPPLGKLLIASGEYLFKANPRNDQFAYVDKVEGEVPLLNYAGYRFFPSLFGAGSILVLYLLLIELTGNRAVSYTITVLGLLDNAFLIQSRAAILDSFLIFFVLASFLAALKVIRTNRVIWWVVLGATSGMAVTVKHTGWIVLLFWLLAFFTNFKNSFIKKIPMLCLMLVCFAAVYISIWKTHYFLAHRVIDENYQGADENLKRVIDGEEKNIFLRTFYQIKGGIDYSNNYNRGVPSLDLCKADEIGSAWYTWPFGGRAINFRWEITENGQSRYLYLIGNPLTWSFVLVSIILGTAITVAGFFNEGKLDKQILGLSFLYWAYLLPFSQIKRVMYLYHYLPSLFFGLILGAVLLNKLTKVGPLMLNSSRKKLIMIFLLIGAFMSFWYFKPLTYYEPINMEDFQKINLLPSWNLKWAGN